MFRKLTHSLACCSQCSLENLSDRSGSTAIGAFVSPTHIVIGNCGTTILREDSPFMSIRMVRRSYHCALLSFSHTHTLTTLVTPNTGDSRAVLCRGGKAHFSTKDHKPTDETEKKRVNVRCPLNTPPLTHTPTSHILTQSYTLTHSHTYTHIHAYTLTHTHTRIHHTPTPHHAHTHIHTLTHCRRPAGT